jgi:hypothetical protein
MLRLYGNKHVKSFEYLSKRCTRNEVPRPSGMMKTGTLGLLVLLISSHAADRAIRTNVVLLFLGVNMLVILLFTSSVFTSWISTHFSSATKSTFNPYLVS